MFNKNKYVYENLNKAVKHLEDDLHYDVVVAAVQGSTNYGLDSYTDEYMSDVDIKAFVIPTFKDLYNNNYVSTTYDYSAGKIEVKDIRLLPALLAKMNPSYIELLQTTYYLFGQKNKNDKSLYWSSVRNALPQLIGERYVLLVKSLYGMMLEKQAALCHPYEGKKEVLAKFGGYDPKQLSHAVRLYIMLRDFVNKKEYKITFDEKTNEFIKDIKIHGVENVETAQYLMTSYVEKAKAVYETVWFTNKTVNTKDYKYPVSTTIDEYTDETEKLVESLFMGH